MRSILPICLFRARSLISLPLIKRPISSPIFSPHITRKGLPQNCDISVERDWFGKIRRLIPIRRGEIFPETRFQFPPPGFIVGRLQEYHHPRAPMMVRGHFYIKAEHFGAAVDQRCRIPKLRKRGAEPRFDLIFEKSFRHLQAGNEFCRVHVSGFLPFLVR